MIRTSVTKLDALHLFQQGVIELEDLIKRLRGETVETEAMQFGRAFHKLLEKIDEIEEGKDTEIDGNVFNANDILLIKNNLKHKPALGVTEIKDVKEYNVDGEIVQVSAVADLVFGETVVEYKTTKYFDIEKYINSYQWRFYMDIFGASKVVYNIFVFYNNQLREVRDFTLFNYKDLQDDIKFLLQDYVKLCSLVEI